MTAEQDGDFIVDAHHHFQDIRRHSYPWLTDPDAPAKLEGDLAPIRRNYLFDDYSTDIAGFAVRKSVHIQNGWNPADPLGETRWLQEIADASGFPNAIVAYADLARPNADELLAAHQRYRATRGIRQILNWHEDPLYRVAPRPDIMDSAAWRRGFSRLAPLGLSFDLQIYWAQMPMARRLAEDFPETAIVLDHFGMPVDRSRAGLRHWRNAMSSLARAGNVSVKLSGFGLGHPNWTAEDTTPLLRQTTDLFGIDRVMVGTNLPVDRLFAAGDEILGMIVRFADQFDPFDRSKLLRENAERIYRI